MTTVAVATSPILLVEDTPSLSMVYSTILKNAGHSVECAFTLAEADAAHKGRKGAVVLLDLMLPDGDGLDLLTEIRGRDPSGKVIVITANGSINRAVDAMRGGAFDFLVKPFDEKRLLAAVDNALTSVVTEPTVAASPPPADAEQFHGFIGASANMRQIYDTISGIGRSTATVFITGESGTGKEVAAQAIHAVSNRANGPFVPINCGAIPKDLLESEVFGHLRGSFTGAIADKPGAAAIADGGTLFLDEICEMDLALQTKLLRFLQTSMINPVGAVRPQKVDVRIVCATNRNPLEEVREGRFREDLFYRLHVVPIELPPLREREGDAVLVARALLRQFAAEEGKSFTSISPAAEALFGRMRWPGNVRQLQNVIRNIVVLNDGIEVTPDMLPLGIREAENLDISSNGMAASPVASSTVTAPASTLPARVAPLVGETLADVERSFIEATIAQYEGSIPRAARVLDVSPSTIYRKRDAWEKG
ncbi:MAG: sigma-54-dependent transcriptional regulator [Pikeienuella sp.]